MDEYMAKISFFGFNYVPVNYLACYGQVIAISENQALYALLGTTFGGDGYTTFGIPDLRGRVVVGAGQGAGLRNCIMGQKSGYESTTLTVNNLPAHTHSMKVKVSLEDATETAATGRTNVLANASSSNIYNDKTPDTPLNIGENSAEVGSTGNGVAFSNQPPYLVLNPCILVQGIWPSRQ